MSRLLVLRPEPGCAATASRARELGLTATVVPLFTIEPIDWSAPRAADFGGLLLTSANAVRFAGQQLQQFRDLCVYAVGQATADAAREAGFEIAAIGDSGVDELLAAIEPGMRLLHLCGEHRRAPATTLQVITAVAVYRALETDNPDLSAVSGSLALIHSPRAARRFAELVKERGSITIVANSRASAKAAGEGWLDVAIAKKPNDNALLALAASLCKKAHPK